MSTAIRYLATARRAEILKGNEPAWLAKHPRRDYVRAGYISVPPWVNKFDMRSLHFYKLAWSRVTGVEFTLDHIVPLNHPHVCGLTVPWNLRLVPRSVNIHKRNEWHPEQGELRL